MSEVTTNGVEILSRGKDNDTGRAVDALQPNMKGKFVAVPRCKATEAAQRKLDEQQEKQRLDAEYAAKEAEQNEIERLNAELEQAKAELEQKNK